MQDDKKFYNTTLIPALKTGFPSPENWLLPSNPKNSLELLMGSVNKMNQTLQDFDKFLMKSQENLKNLHSCVTYIVSTIASTVKKVQKPENYFTDFNTLFINLKELLSNYQNHYKNILNDTSIPIHSLLSALSEEKSEKPGSSIKYLDSHTLECLLQTWVNDTAASPAEMADAIKALGQLAFKKKIKGKPFNLTSIIVKFENNLNQASSAVIVPCLLGLKDLGEVELLKYTISIKHINSLLMKFVFSSVLESKLVVDFTWSIGSLLDNVQIANLSLLNYKALEPSIFKIIPEADGLQLGHLSRNLFLILNSQRLATMPRFSLLEQLFAHMLSYCETKELSSFHIKYISKVIHFVGAIVKTKPYLCLDMIKNSEKIEKQIADLFARLNLIFDKFIKPSMKAKKKPHAELKADIESILLALHGSALLGISNPCQHAKDLAEEISFYLINYSKIFKNYPAMVRQYASFFYMISPPKTKFPEWLKSALEQYKPKPPHPLSTHGLTLTLLSKEPGCELVEPEYLFGEYSMDIYLKYKGDERILELNGNPHFGESYGAELRDLRKYYLLQYKEGITITYFDLETPKRIVQSLRDSPSPQQTKPISPAIPFYRYVGERLSDKSEIWERKTIGKIGASPKAPPVIIPQSEEPVSSWLPPDFKEAEIRSKLPKTKLSKNNKKKKPLKKESVNNEIKISQGSELKESIDNLCPVSSFARIVIDLSIPLIDIYKAANRGNLRAQYILAHRIEIENKINEPLKTERVLFWLQKGIDENYSFSQNDLGLKYLTGQGYIQKDHKEAFRLFTLAADQGLAAAQCHLAKMYHQSHQGVVEKNTEKALSLYKLAAEQGLDHALYMMGSFYEKGEFVTQNLEEAERYYLLAAAQGYGIAQRALGDMYFDKTNPMDKSVVNNMYFKKAFDYYKLSADQGIQGSQYRLGLLYENGIGVNKNVEEAKKLYKLAAAQGQEEAIKALLSLLPQSSQDLKQPITKDQIKKWNIQGSYHREQKEFKQALHFYGLSVEQKDAVAQNELGFMFLSGYGVTKNLQEAIRLFELAHAQGNSLAPLNLAAIYYSGKDGIDRDLKKSICYLKDAASNNRTA